MAIQYSKVGEFQSTYLYKVRLITYFFLIKKKGFNPRTYIRYDSKVPTSLLLNPRFNPRTYIRYDYLNFIQDLAQAVFQSTYLYKVRR